LERADYGPCSRCFVSNAIDVGEAAVKLLLVRQPMGDGCPGFLRSALNTRALRGQFTMSPLIPTLLSSIQVQPCLSFWRLFSHARVLIEYAVSVNFQCPFVIYGVTVATSATKYDPGFEVLYIEEQTEESLAAILRYTERTFTDRTSLFSSISGRAPEVSLLAAAHYYGARIAYGQPPAQYNGLTPANILHFVVVACITYSVSTRWHAAPVMLAMFSSEVYYPMIDEALVSSNMTSRFGQAMIMAMPTLYLFNSFQERIRPIIIRVFHTQLFDAKRMAVFLVYLSNSTVSPTSFVRRLMIRYEGYLRHAHNEPRKETIEQVKEDETVFWRELGEPAVRFLAQQRLHEGPVQHPAPPRLSLRPHPQHLVVGLLARAVVQAHPLDLHVRHAQAPRQLLDPGGRHQLQHNVDQFRDCRRRRRRRRWWAGREGGRERSGVQEGQVGGGERRRRRRRRE